MSAVAVVGPGRVGTLLGRAVARAGWRLVAVAGGSEAAREGLCRCVAGARPTATPAEAAARAWAALQLSQMALKAVAWSRPRCSA